MKGGPAEKSGIKAGDILIEVNGASIGDSQEMLNRVAALKPKVSANFKVLRNRQTLVLAVLVGKRPKGTIRNLEEDDGQ
jgi:serine protease DegQ